MIKVMHVLNTGDYSGAENVVITIINALKEDIDSAYVSLNGSIKEYLDENEIRYEPIRKLTVSEIKRVIEIFHPDVIHAHDFTAGIICAVATNIPIINHIHNNSPWIKHINLRSLVYACSCFRYKMILTVSDSVMNEYVFGIKFKNKTEVVGNPIDIGRIRKLSGNKEIAYDIAFLGRISPQKNPHMFLDIIRAVKNKMPNITAIMIGDGEMRDEIAERIIHEDLERNITLVGFQKNPYQYLNQSMVLLMPSAWEGYGLAAVEALALGKPVVCSNAGGLPTIVNESCGKVCRTQDDYLGVIHSLLLDSEKYKTYSMNAKKRADEIADIEMYSGKIKEFYKCVLRVK